MAGKIDSLENAEREREKKSAAHDLPFICPISRSNIFEKFSEENGTWIYKLHLNYDIHVWPVIV